LQLALYQARCQRFSQHERLRFAATVTDGIISIALERPA